VSAQQPCRRFETEGALRLEQGETPDDPHYDVCAECTAARAAYRNVARSVALARGYVSPPVGWEERVLEHIRSVGRLPAGGAREADQLNALANPPSPGQVMARAAAPGDVQRRVLAGFLVSFQDDPYGKFWPLWKGKNLVGRAETGQKVDIEVDHVTTSTHHAAIECDCSGFVLTDMGSTHGTFHNEEAVEVQGKRDLRDGDKVRFGGFRVIFIMIAAQSSFMGSLASSPSPSFQS